MNLHYKNLKKKRLHVKIGYRESRKMKKVMPIYFVLLTFHIFPFVKNSYQLIFNCRPIAKIKEDDFFTVSYDGISRHLVVYIQKEDFREFYNKFSIEEGCYQISKDRKKLLLIDRHEEEGRDSVYVLDAPSGRIDYVTDAFIVRSDSSMRHLLCTDDWQGKSGIFLIDMETKERKRINWNFTGGMASKHFPDGLGVDFYRLDNPNYDFRIIHEVEDSTVVEGYLKAGGPVEVVYDKSNSADKDDYKKSKVVSPFERGFD